MKRTRTHYRQRYAVVGFVLGLGAPVGWIFWRFVTAHNALLLGWLQTEFAQTRGLYVYMAVGTVLVCTFFGYFLGRRNDALIDESDATKSTLDQINILAMTDALTGIHNARYLHEHLSIEMESAERYKTTLACLLLDIDGFKTVNDTYGHPCGDAVLIQIAKIIRDCVRRIDIVGRLGGEEFLIVMPHTGPETAYPIAERIRDAVQRWPFAIDNARLSVTVSIGIACGPTEGIYDKASLLKAVDDALYNAKRNGKNRTVVAGVVAKQPHP